MEHRERLKKWLDLEPVDRPPFMDWYALAHDRVDEWRKQGLPEGVDVCSYLGFDGSEGYGTEAGTLLEPHEFKMYMYDQHTGTGKVYFNTSAKPEYEERPYNDEDGYLYYIEKGTGITIKSKPPSIDNPLGCKEFFRFPVVTAKDWEDYKSRFNGSDITRYPYSAGEREINHYSKSKIGVEIRIQSIFSVCLNLVGYAGKDSFYERYIDTPDFIEEALDFHECFSSDIIKPALERFRIDFGAIEDGLFYDGGSWVSKDIFKNLLMPRYKRLIKQVKDKGLKTVYAHLGGSFRPFIPEFLEAGADGFSLCTPTSNTDVVELKKEYGKDIRLIGGIDRRFLWNGTKEEIKKEVERVVSVVHMGGVIPCLGHPLYYGTPFENYKYYAEVLGKSLGAL